MEYGKMADILYVRNMRPNAVLIRVDGIKYTVERRGSREDSAALPAAWRDDPSVQTFLNQGILEEISKDAFMTLGSRPEDTIVEERGRPKRVPGPTELQLKDKRGEDEVNIPINNPETSREPYIITEADLRRSTPDRSPQPKFADEVRSTSEDLALIEEARRAAEAHPGQVDFEEDETAQLRKQVTELSSLVQQLLARDAEKQAAEEEAPKKTAAKKAPAKKRGRPKKAGSVSPMDSAGKQELTSRDFME
jgi:hypothetical protein